MPTFYFRLPIADFRLSIRFRAAFGGADFRMGNFPEFPHLKIENRHRRRQPRSESKMKGRRVSISGKKRRGHSPHDGVPPQRVPNHRDDETAYLVREMRFLYPGRPDRCFPCTRYLTGGVGERLVGGEKKIDCLYNPSVIRKSPLTGFGPGRGFRAYSSFSSQLQRS